MEKLSEVTILEFIYDTEEERNNHVKLMEIQGFVCSGQVKRLRGLLTDSRPEYDWYAKFSKSYQ